jgi:hypothetical protein
LGTNEVGTNGAGEGDLGGDTHGAAVYSVLRERLDDIIGRQNRVPSPPPASDPTPGPTSFTDWTVPGAKGPATLRLIAVNSTGWTVDSAIAQTTATVKALKDKFARIVLNLSFVTIPCDPTQFFSAKSASELMASYNTVIKDPKYGDVATALRTHGIDNTVNDTQTLSKIYPFVISEPPLIPLRDCLVSKVYDQVSQEFGSERKTGPMVQLLSTKDSGWNRIATQNLVGAPGGLVVVPVGAAGNGVECAAVKDDKGNPKHMGLPFPFAPALWDFVVSASASDSNGNKAAYANGGELVLSDSHPAAMAKNSYGTSYSAPRLSAVEAMYLANPGTVNCASMTPTLGYITPATDYLPPSPSPAPWKNEPWDHWRNYCGDFNPYMP